MNHRKISEDSDESYKTPQVLIDQLFELHFSGKLDDKIIRDQVETIVIAGNETTALSLSYIILLLAMNPSVQEKVYDELHMVFESQNEEVTYEHIQRLVYLDCVIKEGECYFRKMFLEIEQKTVIFFPCVFVNWPFHRIDYDDKQECDCCQWFHSLCELLRLTHK